MAPARRYLYRNLYRLFVSDVLGLLGANSLRQEKIKYDIGDDGDAKGGACGKGRR